jgi:hypothetical protein
MGTRTWTMARRGATPPAKAEHFWVDKVYDRDRPCQLSHLALDLRVVDPNRPHPT